MSELQSIFLTSGLTIVGGLLIFVIGQFINEQIIKPYIKYKKIIAKIDEELIFFSNIIMSEGNFCNENTKICREASYRFRRLASQFIVLYKQIEWLDICKKIVNAEGKEKVVINLFFLSNSMGQLDLLENKNNKVKQLRKLLKI